MWETVETKPEEVKIVKAKGERREGRSRKKKRRKGKEEDVITLTISSDYT